MAILPSMRFVNLTLALTMTLQIKLAATSSFGVATRLSAPPVITIAPRPNTIARRDGKTTCDGGHGVFTCLFGSCSYDDTGAFACCNGIENCTAVRTCIPLGKEAGGKTCSKGNGACMSCTDSRLPNCYTITNEGMSHSALFCANTGGFQVLSFTFDMSRMTEPAPSPSTFVGAPVPTSSAPASLVGPFEQPSSFIGAPVPISSTPATLVGPPAQPSLTLPTPSSTSTLTLATRTDGPISTVSAIVTVSRWMPVASQDPSPDDGYSHQLPGSTIGGIAIGAIAGAFLLWGGLFFLYVRHKNRKLNRTSGIAGVLPGPRRSADDNDTGGNGNVGSGVTNAMNIPAGLNELPGSGSTPRQSRQSANWTTDPPLPLKNTELQLSPVSPFSQASRMNVNTATAPTITISPTEPSSVENHSPPFTNENTTPLSLIFPSVPPTFSQRPISAATTPFLETAEENMRKSSKMLPMAGPYLTAERALGDGFWEAEREQEEADRAILEKDGLREDGTKKMSVGSPGDDAGMESETSTGTVVRRGVRNTIG